MTASTLSLCLAVSIDDVLNRADMWQEYQIPQVPAFFCSLETNRAAPWFKARNHIYNIYIRLCESRTVGVENNVAGRLKVDVFLECAQC